MGASRFATATNPFPSMMLEAIDVVGAPMPARPGEEDETVAIGIIPGLHRPDEDPRDREAAGSAAKDPVGGAPEGGEPAHSLFLGLRALWLARARSAAALAP